MKVTLSSSPVWSSEQVPGHSGLHGETLSKKKKKGFFSINVLSSKYTVVYLQFTANLTITGHRECKGHLCSGYKYVEILTKIAQL